MISSANADFTKTLNDLKQSIVSQAGDSFKNINLNFDADKALEDGGNFLSSLWQAIVKLLQEFLVLKKFHGIIDGNRNVAVFFVGQ